MQSAYQWRVFVAYTCKKGSQCPGRLTRRRTTIIFSHEASTAAIANDRFSNIDKLGVPIGGIRNSRSNNLHRSPIYTNVVASDDWRTSVHALAHSRHIRCKFRRAKATEPRSTPIRSQLTRCSRSRAFDVVDSFFLRATRHCFLENLSHGKLSHIRTDRTSK